MADLVKKDVGASQWEPLRALRDLMRWDPFREMAPLMGGLERSAFSPSFDVSESKDGYLFKADMPGVKPEDIEVTTTGNRLQIAGKREVEEETKNDTVYSYERQYGSFCRSFTLPDGVDIEHARSELKDGVLTLVVPKKPGAEMRKIPVSAGTSKS